MDDLFQQYAQTRKAEAQVAEEEFFKEAARRPEPPENKLMGLMGRRHDSMLGASDKASIDIKNRLREEDRRRQQEYEDKYLKWEQKMIALERMLPDEPRKKLKPKPGYWGHK